MPKKSLPLILSILLLTSGIAFGQDQLVDDLNDGDRINQLGARWFYYDDDFGIQPNDRPQKAPASVPSIINVAYTTIERHALGNPDDDTLVKVYDFATDGGADKFATMPFTYGEPWNASYCSNGTKCAQPFVGISTLLAAEGSYRDLTTATGIKFKGKSRNAMLTVIFQVETNDILSDSSWAYYQDTITMSTSWQEYTVFFNQLRQPSWTAYADSTPFAQHQVTRITWQVPKSHNTSITTDTLDIDNVYITDIPSPATPPTLITPLQKASGVLLSPVLAWNVSPDATAYHVLVSTSADFTLPKVDETGVTASRYTVSGLATGTNYYWKIGAIKPGQPTTWSATRLFTTGTLPTLPGVSSPGNGAPAVPPPVTIMWESPPPGGTTIELEIYTAPDLNPSSIVVTVKSITSYTYSTKALIVDTKYYWHYRTINNIGNSGWSTTLNFTCGYPLPAAPVLVSPVDLAVNVPVPPELKWNSVSYATTYDVQVATSSDFLTGLLEKTGITSTTTFFDGLSENTAYYWRVAGTNTKGRGTWSTMRNFTTGINRPATPVLLLPVAAATNIVVSAPLSWNSATNAVTYELQVSTVEKFGSVALTVNETGIGTTSFTTPPLLNGTMYYWRVRGANTSGEGNWSEVRTFTTEYVMPNAPQLAAPADGAINIAPAGRLFWKKLSGVISYNLEIATDAGFASKIFSAANITDTSKVSENLNENVVYYWHVSATNPVGTGNWSETRSFTTHSTILLGDFENGHSGTEVGTYWFFYTDDKNGGTSKVNNADPDNGDFMGSYAPGNKSNYAGVIDFKLTPDYANPFVGFGLDFTGDASPLDLTGIIAVQFDIKSSIRVNVTFQHVQTTITDYNYYQQVIKAEAGWYTVTIPLNATDLKQESWGAVAGFDITKTQGIEWQITAVDNNRNTSLGAVVSIDNVRLVGNCSAFRKPYPPILKYPRWKSTNVTTPVRLEWYGGTDAADSYILDVAKDSLFQIKTVDAVTVNDTAYVLGALEGATQYFWRVKSNDYGLTSRWSVVNRFTTAAAAPVPPAVPVLVTPADNATGIAIPAQLQWQTAAGADDYHVLVATGSDFMTPAVNYNAGTSLSYSAATLTPSTMYYWKVGAKNGAGETWSVVQTFTTAAAAPVLPAVPVLVTPADNATGIAIPAQLQWQTAAGADNYQVLVSTTSDFGTPAVNYNTGTALSYAAATLAPSTMYYWKVGAKNSAGETWSAVQIFNTAAPAVPPAIPVLVTPADNATGIAIPAQLQWQTAAGADNYHVIVSTAADFGSPAIDHNAGTSLGYSASTLTPLTKYYWKIRAKNDAGETWSAVQAFTTAEPPPPVTLIAPELVVPAENAIDIPAAVIVQWLEVTGATSYRLQVSKETEFTTPVIDVGTGTATSYTTPSLELATVYHWRACAKNGDSDGPWSARRSFTTVAPLPQTPSITAPVNNASGIGLSFNLAWTAAAGASSYSVQISAEADFDPSVFSSSTAETTAPVNGLSNNVTYFARVRATNTAGPGTWSETVSFTTIVAAPGAPEAASPANNMTDVPVAATVSWKKNTAAVTYSLQVAITEDFTAPLVKEVTATGDTGADLGTLQHATAYFWRVNATNAGGTGAWSTTSKFTTVIAPPPAPAVAAPLSGTLKVSAAPLLAWNKPASASTYAVQVSPDSLFSALLLDTAGLSDTACTGMTLENDKRYFWRVKAFNVGGSGEWSQASAFTTIVAQPAKVATSAVTDGEPVKADSILLVWNGSAPKVVRYRITLATDSLMSNPVIDSACTDTFRIMKGLIHGTTYWWNVQAENEAGWGVCSDKRSFTVMIPVSVTMPERFRASVFGAGTQGNIFQYALPEPCRVIMSMYDIRGALVSKAIDKVQAAGVYSLRMAPQSSGTYYIIFTAGKYRFSRKVVQVR